MKQPNFAAMNPVVAKAIEQMMAEQGEEFSLEKNRSDAAICQSIVLDLLQICSNESRCV